MDLFLFYITQIFSGFHLPLPKEVCASADSIAPMCLTTVSFALIYSVIVVVSLGYFLLKRINIPKNIVFGILSFLSAFFFSDYAMKQIEDPAKYGVEWFTLLYYFWAFLITNLFFFALLFYSKSKKTILFALITTFIFIPVFGYTGRGNFEQVTPIAGGLFAGSTWKLLWLSFSFKLFCFLSVYTVLFGIIAVIAKWIVDGNVYAKYFTRGFYFLLCFFIVLIIPVISIPLGELFNKHDAEEAKNYIDQIKPKVDKYYYENGEYPKFIEKMLPEGSSPRLLDRHEFFTMGIRGTYYFSRSDKYCFLFQNPTRKFGYYSLTTERGWRYNETSGSYDDVFINLCDESNKNYDDLISSHLGVDADNKLINDISVAVGAAIVPATSNKASQILEEKIMEESEKDPSILKYFQSPDKDKNNK